MVEAAAADGSTAKDSANAAVGKHVSITSTSVFKEGRSL